MNNIFCKDTLISKIAEYVAERVDGFSKDLHIDTSFSRLGLDSAAHVQLTAVIEDYLQTDVSPTLAFDYPTINALVNYLVNESQNNINKAS
ncbi:acyl carrier protein [Rheinheimera sp. MMS21-TC3]|uniref:acyl carrier protein n=1 Tax=Rheinheimera sp. MMS21-TC3 TaxID=3072790 RepID=UPI0028C49F38|nr:acyl carrier protein [Rheinheimera sp. MMS21-TC3]WNO60627.1 acyl carrier protein [Rheinheimera sp. MMS21-TC3]